MSVLIRKIEKEIVQHCGPIYKEVEPLNMIACVAEIGGAPGPVQMKEIQYEAHDIWASDFARHPETFYVRSEDWWVFKHLLNISNKQVDDLIEKRCAEIIERRMVHVRDIEATTKKRIKGLPWYERLFNKF